MKKVILFVLISVLVLLTPVLIYAENGPAEKATGDVYFDTPWSDVHLTFNAHETTPANGKGWVYWTRSAPYANWWSGPVIKTDVADTNNAYFTVRVTDGAPVVVGCDITFEVYDGGEPGIGSDTVNITEVVHSGPGNTCAACGQIQGPYTINGGNLQVHTYE